MLVVKNELVVVGGLESNSIEALGGEPALVVTDTVPEIALGGEKVVNDVALGCSEMHGAG